ncbi:ComEA family DNA-binding protein [Algoriphagus formosus]|uniref:ComEA family DNA-binding protein n=1 Tax=Algoriphagus formosus TaxID=2007308 RepID=UPI003F724270
MRLRFLYWLKREIGFSRKESRGFLLVVPVLTFLAFSPELFSLFSRQIDPATEKNLLEVADSLRLLGFEEVSSPFPVRVGLDTVNRSMQGLRKIPFSEADSITLQVVPGVGPTLAARIIKYEVSMGGFFSKDQLKDIYGVQPEVADRIWEYFEFDGEIRNRLAINDAAVEDLAKHPYISYGQAKVIIAYRNQHGNYEQADDLLKIRIFDPEWIQKIAPYLTF